MLDGGISESEEVSQVVPGYRARDASLCKTAKYDIVKVMKKSISLIFGVFLGISLSSFLYAPVASAAPFVFCLPGIAMPSSPEQRAYNEKASADCLQRRQQAEEAQKQAQLQKEYTDSCQNYIDGRGGHGTSVYDASSALCKTTCDTGYQFANSNGCVPNPTVISQSVIPTESVQQTKQSSGLTDSQIQAIVMLLQAFGADQAVVVQVETALRSNTVTHYL